MKMPLIINRSAFSKACAIFVSFLSTATTGVQGSIVVNGSFEQDWVDPSIGYLQQTPTGWSQLGSSSVEIVNEGYGDGVAAEGDKFVDLIAPFNSQDFPSGLKQTVYLEAGSYNLAFQYNGGGGGRYLDYSVGQLLQGQLDTLGLTTFGSSATPWQMFVGTFVVASAGAYDLVFSTPNPNVENPSQAPFIDAVSITPVPEPATYIAGALLLLPLGLGLLTKARRVLPERC